MEDENISTALDLAKTFVRDYMKFYMAPLYEFVKDNPHLIHVMPGFILGHEKLVVYIGRTHIGLELIGPEIVDELREPWKLSIECYDFSTKDGNLIEEIIGFRLDAHEDLLFELPPVAINLLLPTNRGIEKLHELKWNFLAQESILGINVPSPVIPKGRFSRIVNGMFFDCNETGLVSRRIKWLDLVPIDFDGSNNQVDHFSFDLTFYKKLVECDANFQYPIPEEFKYRQLPKINKFIEIWASGAASETNITQFLSQDENRFILTMKFGATEAYAELTCQWQSESKANIRPDFFLVQPNGYADILEFKLPRLNGNVSVGTPNRERFSAEISSYVAQTRVYRSYFEDPNNRAWFRQNYGFNVYKPRRILVIGRRADFEPQVWREIQADHQDLEIITFDDLIDGVVVQFYKK
ncbi:Shedu anti-phage system protein SduA domain-containing protein [Flavobacterium sp.]|uniref:Shedu anti-phage system protein SduA domain-containing protein n=1 Tax=Flavobacterium sp. TaxID=239 RepID=UPI002607C8D5|nr:Shedu anti-phage system protein SduA domain-containing protein [Flavobacterium sp.]